MKTTTTLSLAFSALLRAKLRSFLTMLGVVIGVAAVVIMQSMGVGATAQVTGEVAGLGSNILMVVPGARHGMSGGPQVGAPLFARADLEAIRRDCPAVRYAAAFNSRSLRVVAGERNRPTNVNGISPEHLSIRDWPVARGRTLQPEDEHQAAKVCVVGDTIRRELFGSQDPVGAELRVRDMTCRVVGLLEAKGASTFGFDQDDVVFMPSTTFGRRIMGSDEIGTIMISAVSDETIDEAKRQIEGLMRQRRRILADEEDDFSVRDMREILAMLGTITRVLTSLLAGVAAVSLVVGGIGIMNIMLVSVTERTREIGVRLAVGARARDILAQFLVEAVTLSVLGGVLGLLLGIAGALATARALDLPFIVPPQAAALAIGVSILVGVVFGSFPARKAARLHPIEALRFE